ncbi:MAG: chloride channel protein [Anaerolineae bacterium]
MLSGIHRKIPFLRAFRPSQNMLVLALAIAVGLSSSAGVWAFRLAIDGFHRLFNEWLAAEVLGGWLGPYAIVPMLALAGLLVGLIMHFLVGEERHHGVAAIMESVALAGGRLRYHVAPFKALAAALSLGAGASVGPEDPSVQIGANMGSFLGQRLRLAEENVQVLVGAGTASAIAMAFNAPIAGVFFALEVILGEFTTSSVGVVVLSAVMGSVFRQAVEPNIPELGILNFTLEKPLEIALYIPLGLLLVPFAVGFIRMVYWQRDQVHRLDRLPRPLKTALAGALVGVVGVFLPQVLGTGREAMREVLTGSIETTASLLVILALAKLVMTALSLAGGFQGGVFAPSLFIGTMLGSAFGRLVNLLGLPALSADPQAFAIAGMAGVMAGVMRAPITAILLVFELTHDYRLILPIMFTTVVCTYFTSLIEPHSIYSLGLARHGIRLQQGRDVDVMQGVAIRDAMRTPAPTIAETASLLELRDALRQYNTRALCVVDEDGLLSGIVTLADLQRAYSDAGDASSLTVGDICARDVITAEPDDVLWSAIHKMGAFRVGSLPIVRPMTRQVVGMLMRDDVLQAYRLAIAKKLEDQHRAEQIRLNTLTGAHTLEMHVTPTSPVAGRRIGEIAWPGDCLVASIRRKGRLIVPHGSTELQPGDRVTIVAEAEVYGELEALFKQDGV